MTTRVLVFCFATLAGGAGVLLAGASAAGSATARQPARIEGKAAEVMNSGGYTYVRIDGAVKGWVAAPETTVKVGDSVVANDAMPMTNFHSKTLNRTFDVVYFSGSLTVNGKAATAGSSASISAPAGHGSAAPSKPAVDLSNIKPAPGGKTVAGIHAAGAAQAGKKVAVRGRVVKYNGGILGKNWLHIRDGSGTEGTNDLTVTTKDTAKVGDLVLVEGVLSANRDFGGGYKYGLIIEDAKIVVE